MSRDLRELLHDTAARPTHELDASGLVAKARRQTMALRAAVVVVALVAVAGAVLAVTQLRDGAGQETPRIVDQPDDDEVVVPDGWQTLTAGQLAVSVPPDWDVIERQLSPDDDESNGPCFYELYRGWLDDSSEDAQGPHAVVHPHMTGGGCRLVGVGEEPPAHPGIVLYAGIRDDPGDQRTRSENLEERGAPRQVGAAQMWRIDEGPLTRLEMVEGHGGLMVSHVNDPVVQQVLSTVRFAPQDEASDLLGRTFLSTSVTEDSDAVVLFDGVQVEISFQDPPDWPDVIVWRADCNTTHAQVHVTRQRLFLAGGGSSLIGCEQPALERDEWLSQFFEQDPAWRLDGGVLALTAGNRTIRLQDASRRPSDTERDARVFWDRTFVSTSVAQDGEPVEDFDDVRVTVTFEQGDDSPDVVRWEADCNTGMADVGVTDDQLSVGVIGTTWRACDEPADSRDEWLAGFFGADPNWQLEDGALTLTAGERVMQLRGRQGDATGLGVGSVGP